MRGLLTLAYKLLVTDRLKFATLVSGIAFAVFLLVFVTSALIGELRYSASMVTNIGASVWVMDAGSLDGNAAVGMPDYALDAVRSMSGVKYAVPLYSGGGLVKLSNGRYQAVTVIGLDETSLLGRPKMLKGKIQDIYTTNSFIAIDDSAFSKLGNPHIGATFELNDHRGVIVGIARVPLSGLRGVPTLYTTYYRALQYVPNPRYTISYILVEPKSVRDVPRIERQVRALGYLALSKDEFRQALSTSFLYRTDAGVNIGLITVFSVIIGLTVSGLIFYTFVLENRERFGALKAIGTTGRELTGMILFQAGLASFTGYGLGVGACTAIIGLAKLTLPEFPPTEAYANLGLALLVSLVIAAVSGYIGIRAVLRIEPFDVFRG
ncbi:MAG: ABC transporter permease [Terriglobia bacterium]